MPDPEDIYGAILARPEESQPEISCFRDRLPCSRDGCAAWCFDSDGEGYCALIAAAEGQAAYYGRMTQIIDQSAAGGSGAPPFAG